MVKIIYTDKLQKGTFIQIDGVMYEGIRTPILPPKIENKNRFPILQKAN